MCVKRSFKMSVSPYELMHDYTDPDMNTHCKGYVMLRRNSIRRVKEIMKNGFSSRPQQLVCPYCGFIKNVSADSYYKNSRKKYKSDDKRSDI